MLRRKSREASRRLADRTSDLRELMDESRRRIGVLRTADENNKNSNHNMINADTAMPEDDDREEDQRVRIETKLRLWTLLHQDLVRTMSVVQS